MSAGPLWAEGPPRSQGRLPYWSLLDATERAAISGTRADRGRSVPRIIASKRRGLRRALPAAILTVALAVAGVPVVGMLTAEPASAALVGEAKNASGQDVY